MSDAKSMGVEEPSTSLSAPQLHPTAVGITGPYNHQPAQMAPTLENLPIEIFLQIAELLDAEDLKKVYSCSSRLACNSRALLCRNLNVTETYESLKRMLSICGQDNEISRGIKTLTYIPLIMESVCDENIDRQDWPKLGCGGRRNRVIPFMKYLCLSKDWSNMINTMANVDYLVLALASINACTIRINVPHFSSWTLPSHSHFLRLHNEVPMGMRTWYDSSVTSTKGKVIATRSFIAVLLALAQADHLVQALEATTGLMFLSSPHIDKFCNAIGKLKKLHLTILNNDSEADLAGLRHTQNQDYIFPFTDKSLAQLFQPAYDKHGLQKWTLGKFLSHATNLEDLTIVMRHEHERVKRGARFEDDLAELSLLGVGFPNLRTLTLDNIRCTGDGLLALFLQCGRLTHADLEDLSIFDTADDWLLWPRFFFNLRTQVKTGRLVLKTIKLYGHFDRHSGFNQNLAGWDEESRPHMGVRKNRDGFQYYRCSTLGRNIEDFVLGKNVRCLWKPVDKTYYRFNRNANLKFFLDDTFDKTEESDIQALPLNLEFPEETLERHLWTAGLR